jgi:hypothetical protein
LTAIILTNICSGLHLCRNGRSGTESGGLRGNSSRSILKLHAFLPLQGMTDFCGLGDVS